MIREESLTDSEEAPVGNLTRSWPCPMLRQARASCLPLRQASDSTVGKEPFFRYKTGLSHSSYLRQLRKTDAQARSHTVLTRTEGHLSIRLIHLTGGRDVGSSFQHVQTCF